MTKGFLKETNIRGSSYFEINQAWQYISYMNIALLMQLFYCSVFQIQCFLFPIKTTIGEYFIDFVFFYFCSSLSLFLKFLKVKKEALEVQERTVGTCSSK